MSSNPVLELRLVLTTDNFEELLAFYRDAVGLREEMVLTGPDGSVALLEAGRATLEISDRKNAEFIDRIEAGGGVSGPVRIALRVVDAHEATDRLSMVGTKVLGQPKPTPFGSINARLQAPDGLQLTLFQQQGDETWVPPRP